MSGGADREHLDGVASHMEEFNARAARRARSSRVILRELIAVTTEERLGTRVICTRCGATLAGMDDLCKAGIDEPCPGGEEIDRVRAEVEKELGW